MSKEKVEINVDILGERLRLVLPGDGWTFEEAKLAKDVSEGLAPAEIEGRLLVGDPDAWLAVLRVSYLRARRPYPTEEIEGVDMMTLVEAITAEVDAFIAKRPPTSPSGKESAEPDAPSESEPAPALSSA